MTNLKHNAWTVLAVVFAIFCLSNCGEKSRTDTATATLSADTITVAPLVVAISPYQDIAQIVNYKDLGLEKKYGVKLELVTMAWDDILPAIASKGRTVDVGFGSLIEYLSKCGNMNGKSDDPVTFVHPAYVFRGGGFISFDKQMPLLTPANVNDVAVLKKFLSYSFGIQKKNVSEMILYSLARKAGIKPSELHTTDNTINDCLLACEHGSLNASFAGLTQRTEALKRGGRIVLTMDTVGLADITGFVCKKSTLDRRRKDVESLIKIWYDCSGYVTGDLDHHSNGTLAYLKANASTQYTLAEFKRALTQEYFPRTLAEAQKEIVSPAGKYSMDRISKETGEYLMEIGAVKEVPAPPKAIAVESAPVSSQP